jgi:predicted permease
LAISNNVLGMQFFLLCLMLVGLVTAKARIIDEHTRSSMGDLILGVFLPCNILSSFFGADRSQLPSMGIILVISAVTLTVCFVLAKYLLYRWVGTEQKKVLLYATIISNASFLGNPVIESIFGLEALVYSAAYLVPLRIALWTVGLAIFSGGKGSLIKLVFHPCLVGTYLGLLVMLTGFAPPPLVSRLVFSLGNCTTPISMMVVGSILALVEPRKMIGKLTIYYSFIRLILIPLMVMGALLVFRPVPVVLGVSVILSGTPAPVTTSILANKFGADRELASKIIFASTLLSVVTIPGLLWLLQKII